MFDYRPALDWIASQQDVMKEQVVAWSRINTGSTNLQGLAEFLFVMKSAFAPLGGTIEEIALPDREVVDGKGNVTHQKLGKALRISKRMDAPLRIYLGGHMDTVFAADHPFQEPRWLDANTLNGPGVADLKGGLAVMLTALTALDRSPYANNIGWEVLLNSDEEIGSPGSAALIADAAKRVHLGLIYEPALADGGLAGARKGSGNFTAVMRGKAAHAGRDFAAGRNAIVALSEYIVALHALNGVKPGVTVNPGKIEGGGPVNLVPDLAICRFNIRVADKQEQAWVERELANITMRMQEKEGFQFSLHGGFGRAPKVLSAENERLFDLLKACGDSLGIGVCWKPTGGCCDGNNLAAAGIPNIDSLGVRGGNLHTDQEFMLADSLVERAQLSALLLLKLASGEFTWGTEKML